jgi:hypothetical protein
LLVPSQLCDRLLGAASTRRSASPRQWLLAFGCASVTTLSALPNVLDELLRFHCSESRHDRCDHVAVALDRSDHGRLVDDARFAFALAMFALVSILAAPTDVRIENVLRH